MQHTISQTMLIGSEPRQATERTGPIMKALGGYLNRLRRYYRTKRELARLTDRELADLGIQRGDISRIAYDTAQY